MPSLLAKSMVLIVAVLMLTFMMTVNWMCYVTILLLFQFFGIDLFDQVQAGVTYLKFAQFVVCMPLHCFNWFEFSRSVIVRTVPQMAATFGDHGITLILYLGMVRSSELAQEWYCDDRKLQIADCDMWMVLFGFLNDNVHFSCNLIGS